MKTVTLLVVTLCATATAYADFSYTTTRKAQGPPAAAAAPSTTKYMFAIPAGFQKTDRK